MNPLKLVDLRFHTNLQNMNPFESLPAFANVRALVINCANRRERDTAELAQLLTPLASFDKLQALYLRLLPDCWSETNLKTLKNVVRNNKALREIALYCEGSNTQSTPALYDTLSEHPFSHVHLKGFDIKTLHFLGVSHLKSLALAQCGVLREGFKKTPKNLHEMLFERTNATEAALDTLPTTLKKLSCHNPNTLAVFCRMHHLTHCYITKDESLDTPLSCIERLDDIPLSRDLRIEIRMSDASVKPHIALLKKPLERQPALCDKIVLDIDGIYQSLADFLREDEPLDENTTTDAAATPST